VRARDAPQKRGRRRSRRRHQVLGYLQSRCHTRLRNVSAVIIVHYEYRWRAYMVQMMKDPERVGLARWQMARTSGMVQISQPTQGSYIIRRSDCSGPTPLRRVLARPHSSRYCGQREGCRCLRGERASSVREIQARHRAPQPRHGTEQSRCAPRTWRAVAQFDSA
jgi:hypothetical protein